MTGRFENSVAYGDIYLPTWKDVSPRTSVVYDLFGNGKTAIRGGFNKYMTGSRGCVYKTPGCEIDFSSLPANFGVRALSTFDPNLSRPYQLMYNVGVSHELVPGTSVTAEWFHSDFKNLIERNNANIKVTASFGVSNYPKGGDTVDEIMQKADLDMYAEKGLRKAQSNQRQQPVATSAGKPRLTSADA